MNRPQYLRHQLNTIFTAPTLENRPQPKLTKRRAKKINLWALSIWTDGKQKYCLQHPLETETPQQFRDNRADI